MSKSMSRVKLVASVGVAGVVAVVLGACGSKANVASHNLSKAADNFQVPRSISFYNGITGENILIIKGLCSVGEADRNGSSQNAPENGQTLTVTCKRANGTFIKDFLGLSDNVSYVVQQEQGVKVNDAHYQLIWRPSTLIPHISVQG